MAMFDLSCAGTKVMLDANGRVLEVRLLRFLLQKQRKQETLHSISLLGSNSFHVFVTELYIIMSNINSIITSSADIHEEAVDQEAPRQSGQTRQLDAQAAQV